MLGAIIGDIVGSRFEFKDFKSRHFKLLAPDCHPTDDSLMTLAVAKGLVHSHGDESVLWEKTASYMREIARKHPNVGWGERFFRWVFGIDNSPQDSFGNGALRQGEPAENPCRRRNKRHGQGGGIVLIFAYLPDDLVR